MPINKPADTEVKKSGLNLGALKKVVTSTKSAAKKEERPVMQLSPGDTQAFVELIEISTIKKVVDSRFENQGVVVKQACYDEFVGYLWKFKAVPANPKIETKTPAGTLDHSGIYQFRAQFTIDIPEPTDEMSGEDLILEALTGGDGDDRLDEAQAIRLIKDEIDLTPIYNARSLNELLEGHYDRSMFVEATALEQSAGEKLQKFLLARSSPFVATTEVEAFSDAEAEVAISRTLIKKVRDPKGFLARVCGYCRTKAELKRVLSVIVPQQQTSHMKFAESDSLEQKSARLQDAARRVIGMSGADSDED